MCPSAEEGIEEKQKQRQKGRLFVEIKRVCAARERKGGKGKERLNLKSIPL